MPLRALHLSLPSAGAEEIERPGSVQPVCLLDGTEHLSAKAQGLLARSSCFCSLKFILEFFYYTE